MPALTDIQAYLLTVSLLVALAGLPVVALAGVILGASMAWRMAHGAKPVALPRLGRKAPESEPTTPRLPPPPKARA